MRIIVINDLKIAQFSEAGLGINIRAAVITIMQATITLLQQPVYMQLHRQP